jgi:hypothetical protein
MPVNWILTSREFTDSYGVVSTAYKTNAGDSGTYEIEFEENILFSSSNQRPITSNPVLRSQNRLKFPDRISMLGFEIGYSVVLTRTNSNGSTVTATVTITDINYEQLTMQFSALLSPANQNLDLYNDTTVMTIYATNMREQLTVSLGFVPSTAGLRSNFIVDPLNPSPALGLRNSLIDGALSQVRFPTSGIAEGGSSTSGVSNPASGMFTTNVTIARLTNVNAYTRKWKLTFSTVQIGAYIPNFFDGTSGTFIRLYYDLGWKKLGNEENETITQWIEPSNTARFDKAYLNDSVNSSVLTAPTNELTYDSAVTNTITFSSTSSVIGMGAQYLPKDDAYFKNKSSSQTSLAMLLNSAGPLAIGTYLSAINPDGARFEIEITTLTYAANVHTVTYIFRYNNQAFINFMQGRSADDRNILVWFKVGNINHLVHNENIVKAPKTILNLEDYDAQATVFNTDKTSDTYNALSGLKCSIEDNVRLYGEFLVPKLLDYQNVKYEVIVAEIGNEDNNFVLQSNFFDLSNIQSLPNGALPLFALSQPAGLNLGDTATIFRNAILTRKGQNSDTTNEFLLTCLFPFLINWKYWLTQNNAFIVFNEERNQNWINYNNGTYLIYCRLSIETANSIFTSLYPINTIYDYDEAHTDTNEEWNGTTAIEYFVVSTGQQVNALINDELMRVKVTVNNDYAGTLSTVWGQMTIEPKESSPRWNISTNYNADTNLNNPFQPLSGQTRLKHTVVSGTEHTFEAIIDTDKLTGTEHKITLKFYNDVTPIEQNRSEFDVILTNFTQLQPIDEDDCIDCCDNFTVFANDNAINPTPDNAFRRDLTAMFFLLSGGDSVKFKVDYEGVNVTDDSGLTFPNQSNARYVQVDWDFAINTYGAGFYKLYIEYTSADFEVTEYLWGYYDLKHYTRETAEGFVNIKSYLNTNQSTQGINFTGVALIDSINVQGFFGNRDPRMEIDNNIYNTRLQTKVVRENLNEYTLTTNPVTKAYTRKLLDLHLLNENDCYITDYNTFNHEDYVNKRVIVSGVESPEYYEYSKYSKIIAKFEDKIKNSRSFY